MKKIKVTIIIPCYNSEKTIDKCLNSILKDKLSEKEIIIINDGSNDNTSKKLENYKEKSKNIKIINQENKGQALARNEGIKLAKGKYIMFIDSDDYIEKNYIYKMYTAAEKNNSDYVFCDYYLESNNKKTYVRNEFNDDIPKIKLIVNFSPWAKLISTKLIKKIDFKFPELRMYEDIAVIPILAVNSKNAYYLKEALYTYNTDNNSIMRKKEYDDSLLDIIKASDILYGYFKKNNLLEKYNEELKYIYSFNILKCGALELAKYKEGKKYIKELQKNVKVKFSKLLLSKYTKYEIS